MRQNYFFKVCELTLGLNSFNALLENQPQKKSLYVQSSSSLGVRFLTVINLTPFITNNKSDPPFVTHNNERHARFIPTDKLFLHQFGLTRGEQREIKFRLIILGNCIGEGNVDAETGGTPFD